MVFLLKDQIIEEQIARESAWVDEPAIGQRDALLAEVDAEYEAGVVSYSEGRGEPPVELENRRGIDGQSRVSYLELEYGQHKNLA